MNISTAVASELAPKSAIVPQIRNEAILEPPRAIELPKRTSSLEKPQGVARHLESITSLNSPQQFKQRFEDRRRERLGEIALVRCSNTTPAVASTATVPSHQATTLEAFKVMWEDSKHIAVTLLILLVTILTHFILFLIEIQHNSEHDSISSARKAAIFISWLFMFFLTVHTSKLWYYRLRPFLTDDLGRKFLVAYLASLLSLPGIFIFWIFTVTTNRWDPKNAAGAFRAALMVIFLLILCGASLFSLRILMALHRKYSTRYEITVRRRRPDIEQGIALQLSHPPGSVGMERAIIARSGTSGPALSGVELSDRDGQSPQPNMSERDISGAKDMIQNTKDNGHTV
ncbi:hypothetical protein B0O99DRAFT_683431 [Bisporella sp. PMI_857]|nr:hypothetical protein B0O99DRAFT_683431 [Bisporella sp. PMI_857]